jgi:hypothetical protein
MLSITNLLRNKLNPKNLNLIALIYYWHYYKGVLHRGVHTNYEEDFCNLNGKTTFIFRGSLIYKLPKEYMEKWYKGAIFSYDNDESKALKLLQKGFEDNIDKHYHSLEYSLETYYKFLEELTWVKISYAII